MTDDRWKERWKLGNPEMDKEIFLDDSTLYSDEKDTGCELTSESMPLQSALTAAVQTSVGVTEISLASNASSKTNNEQVAQL